MAKHRRANYYQRHRNHHGEDADADLAPTATAAPQDEDVKSVNSDGSDASSPEVEALAQQAGEVFGLCMTYLVTALCGLFRRCVGADLKVTLDMIDRVKFAGLAAATFIVALWVQYLLRAAHYSDALALVGISTTVLWFLIERMSVARTVSRAE